MSLYGPFLPKPPQIRILQFSATVFPRMKIFDNFNSGAVYMTCSLFGIWNSGHYFLLIFSCLIPTVSAFGDPDSIIQGDTTILCPTIPLSFASLISIWVCRVPLTYLCMCVNHSLAPDQISKGRRQWGLDNWTHCLDVPKGLVWNHN